MPKWLRCFFQRCVTNFTYKIEDKASEVSTVYQLACKYYKNVVEREAALANITDKDHILCIGGGICPFTAILFHQHTGAKVTVIDNNKDCIPKARQVIKRLGIDERVHVHLQDGANAETDLSEYSVIHMALQVDPIDHVFYQIEKQSAPGAKLLIRRPKKALGSGYSEFQSEHLSYCAYVSHKDCNIGSTFLYVKPEVV